MIIKTLRPHADASRLGRYLTKDSKDNERIEDRGTRGTVAADTCGALKEMAASRHGSRCQQPLYHVVFNAAKGEHLTPEQWEQALSMWESELGLGDRQRSVVQHFKDGRWHTHVVYNRIDMLTGKAVNIGRDHFKAKRVARQIEEELGLQKVANKRTEKRRERQPPHKWELEQTRRTKADANEIHDRITQAWGLSDNGRTFQHALAAQGLTLAQGDRRPFVVLDKDGNFFALSGRTLPHARMKDIRAKLADVNRDQLPTVAIARRQQRQKEREQRARPEPKQQATRDEPAARTEQAASAIHEKHRSQHLELNRQARKAEQDHTRAAAALARAHERERQNLSEKQRDRWWHKLIKKTKKVRDEEARARTHLDEQQAHDMTKLEEHRKQELKAIEAHRAELRAAERDEARLAKAFQKQTVRQKKIDEEKPLPAPEKTRQRFNAAANRRLAREAARQVARNRDFENER